ncbi:hypothetical protein MRB53_013262 [Persea americana]|uniref:Uncharacterized protein n=1 Tax=Persea americana TaxID=3435 RepID=A0ACC2K7U0_PERAE|nr:hypothetical protein MRB53_013262 [Persea americana]
MVIGRRGGDEAARGVRGGSGERERNEGGGLLRTWNEKGKEVSLGTTNEGCIHHLLRTGNREDTAAGRVQLLQISIL